MTCNKSIKCTVGSDSFNAAKDTEAYKLMKEAYRQALLRAHKIVREAWVLHEARDITNMEPNHRNVVGFIYLGSFFRANDISMNGDVVKPTQYDRLGECEKALLDSLVNYFAAAKAIEKITVR